MRVKLPDTFKQAPPPTKAATFKAEAQVRYSRNPFSDSFNKIPNSDITGMEDDIFTVSKLNLPSSKGQQTMQSDEDPQKVLRLTKNPTQGFMPSPEDASPMNMKDQPRFMNQSEVRNMAHHRDDSSKKDYHSVKTLTNKQSSKLTYD